MAGARPMWNLPRQGSPGSTGSCRRSSKTGLGGKRRQIVEGEAGWAIFSFSELFLEGYLPGVNNANLSKSFQQKALEKVEKTIENLLISDDKFFWRRVKFLQAGNILYFKIYLQEVSIIFPTGIPTFFNIPNFLIQKYLPEVINFLTAVLSSIFYK